AALRTFRHFSSNQGFKYLYVPAQRCIPIGQLLCLHTNSSHVLNVYYLGRYLVILFTMIVDRSSIHS
ncbi:hypothetical protein BCV72DRAFT_314857, partial [Rhizopus microsporus var. microsporus]